ncbi:MAG: cytochrome c peroxidase [Gallionella sp.]
MVKRFGGISLALSGLALSAAVYYFSDSPPSEYRALQENPRRGGQYSDGQEPITPIPLELKLDTRKVALGRRLFYDPQLSHDNTISCSTCHDLARGGVDGLPFPVGIGKKQGDINTLTVFNSGFNFRMFWDGRATLSEDQMDFSLHYSGGMATTWPEIIAKLEKEAAYRRDFAAIYPENIQPSSVKDAIITFQRSLITPNAKFDHFLRGDKLVLDKDERAGYELFKSLGCISCHQGMNVGGNMYEKLGILDDYFSHRGNVRQVDFGRYNVTGIDEHRYEFRVPSLRNVALTAPYFHDASAGTLEQAVAVMGKYQLGVIINANEVTKIVKFLNTLTGIYQGETGK